MRISLWTQRDPRSVQVWEQARTGDAWKSRRCRDLRPGPEHSYIHDAQRLVYKGAAMLRSCKTRAIAAGAVCAAVSLAASGVHAHPVPALAPDFGMPECITVVDKRTSDMVPLDYVVGFDDIAEEPDHIPVPEQKTHQFFAFRGQVTGSDPEYFYWPFDPALQPRARMPIWIDQTDLQTCAAKNTPMIAPDFSPEKIGAETLTERPDLAHQFLDVRKMRVPITERQALLGLRWALADVPAGVYGIAGYIYSPPYNAWEGRQGVVKVIDGTRDVPAVTVGSVDAMLFAGQGRKVTGCVNAAKGSELQAYYRAAETGAAWEMWAQQPIDDTGKYELCYRSPMPGYSGIVELQIVAVSPEGEKTAAYPPDQLVLVAGAANCTPSAKLCCDAAAATGAAGAAASSVSMDSSATGEIVQAAAAAGSGGAAMSTQPAGAMQSALMETPKAASSGCAVGSGRGGTGNTRDTKPENTDLWCALVLLLTAAGMRKRARAR